MKLTFRTSVLVICSDKELTLTKGWRRLMLKALALLLFRMAIYVINSDDNTKFPRKTDRQSDRLTARQKDSQIDIQMDRQMDRQPERVHVTLTKGESLF